MHNPQLSWPALALLLFTSLGLGLPSHAAEHADETRLEQVRQEASDLLEAIKGYSAAQRDEAVEATRSALVKVDQRLERLEQRIDDGWDQMSSAAREEARATQRALRRQRIQLAERYGSLKTSSAEAWDEMKKGFSEAYADLQAAWEKAEQDFQDNQ